MARKAKRPPAATPLEFPPRLWECPGDGHRQSTGNDLGGYRVGELLGRGAMGAVYAREDADGRQVALKVLSRARARRAVPAAVPPRGAVRGNARRADVVPPSPSARRRHALPGDGVRRRHDLREILRREGARAGARRRARRPGGRRARRRACGRARPPRREARQHPRRDADGEHAYVCDFGLARTSRRSGASPATGVRRHGRLRLARADRGRKVDGRGRRLRAGLRALRVPRGESRSSGTASSRSSSPT